MANINTNRSDLFTIFFIFIDHNLIYQESSYKILFNRVSDCSSWQQITKTIYFDWMMNKVPEVGKEEMTEARVITSP